MSLSWSRLRWQILTAGLVVGVWTVVYFLVITYAPMAYDPAVETKAKMDFSTAVILFMPTAVYVVAAQVLLYFWLSGPGARLSKMDPPQRLLALAVATLPDRRREWGAAMVGELADVQGRSARWRFALSCARAALWPRPGNLPVLVLVAGAVVAATVLGAPAIEAAVPGLDVFAVTFIGMAGALALLGVLRSRRLRFPTPAPTILVIGSVVAAITAVTVFLYQEPSAAEFLSPVDAVQFAAIAAASLWVALASPRSLGTSRLAAHLGAAAAVVTVVWQLLLGYIANNVLSQPEPLQALGGLFLVFGPTVIFFLPAFFAAKADRSFRSGLKAGVWTFVSYLPLVFSMWLFEAMRIYAATGKLFLDVDPGPIGANIDQAMFWCLTFVPVVGIPCAVFGAGIAAYVFARPAEPKPVATQ